jgi:hypothetical protein
MAAMTRWPFALAFAIACHPATRTPTPVDVGDELVTAIETGDYQRALRVWCDGYAAAGLPCASTIRVELLESTNVLSRMDESHVVRMQPMPPKGGGLAYWDNWSKLLAGGAWRPQFVDDDDARRIASTMLLTVMAHELGHHLAIRHACHVAGMEGELLADELSTPLVQQLAHGRFGELHARMRHTADAMIAAVPEATRMEVPRDVDVRTWVRARELPSETAAYASLHLSRQRRLLEETPRLPEVADRRCGAKSRARLAQRLVEPGTVRTRGEWKAAPTERIAIDPTGAVWGFAQDSDRELEVIVRRVDHPAEPPRVVSLPSEPRIIVAVAAASASRFVISDRVRTWELVAANAHLVARELAKPPDTFSMLAFDRDAIQISEQSKTEWRSGPWRIALVPKDPETLLPTSTEWRDGPQARGEPWQFAVAGDRLVFSDTHRSAIRAIGPRGVTTIAGSLEGRRDGSTADAQFLDVVAVAALADGTYAVAERGAGTVVLRIITPS